MVKGAKGDIGLVQVQTWQSRTNYGEQGHDGPKSFLAGQCQVKQGQAEKANGEVNENAEGSQRNDKAPEGLFRYSDTGGVKPRVVKTVKCGPPVKGSKKE